MVRDPESSADSILRDRPKPEIAPFAAGKLLRPVVHRPISGRVLNTEEIAPTHDIAIC